VSPANRRQSARIRAFVDFLVEAFAADEDLAVL
jgi:DNA-binding transcriptional LysR family regulator